MSQAPTFVVIDFNAESRFLLVKSLRRRFPSATIYESDDEEKVIEIARAVDLAAIVAHRTQTMSGAELVRRLRNAAPQVPIIMVSGVNREADARSAGATCFLHYDEWPRIGGIVEGHLRSTGGTVAPFSDAARAN